jgi:hypothetical protein
MDHMQQQRMTWKNEFPTTNWAPFGVLSCAARSGHRQLGLTKQIHSAQEIGNARWVSVACGRYHVCSVRKVSSTHDQPPWNARYLAGHELCLLVLQLRLLFFRQDLWKMVSHELAASE